jgi:cytochrome c5
MATTPHPIGRALEIMDAWLGLPSHAYKATVYRFAQDLPPNEVLEAVEIAQAKIPCGGKEAFKYFCGVCHGKIKEQRIRLSWN